MREKQDSNSEGRGAHSALRRIWAIPAVKVLLIQCASFVPMLGVVYLLAWLGAVMHGVHAALVQGMLAWLLGRAAGLPRSWRIIQFVLPLALAAALELALPPTLYLAAFLLMLALYWSTFRTRVPYYPSGRPVRDAVADLLPDGPARVVDIGSGFGGLVLDLARRRADIEAEGIEIAPLPWLASRLRALVTGSRARFRRGDYEVLDFARYDLVFAYLSPAVMEGLWYKASREMRPGTTLASYEFIIKERAPDRILAPDGGRRALYIWHF